MYNTPYSERMNLKGHVQGFTVGAAVMGALMLGLPALTSHASPSSDMDELAARFGVEVIWSDVSPCTPSTPRAAGCWSEAMPSRIFVRTDLDPEYLRYVVLHEIGHVTQWRAQLPASHCGADMFAQAFGSSQASYYCWLASAK